MEQINLNLIPGKIRPVCHASQNDVGRQIRCNLFEGENVFSFASGDTAELHIKKPDGETLTSALSVTANDSFVDVITSAEMTAAAGSGLCKIRITRGDNDIGTLNFIMEIEGDPTAGAGPGPEPQDIGLVHTDFNFTIEEYEVL